MSFSVSVSSIRFLPPAFFIFFRARIDDLFIISSPRSYFRTWAGENIPSIPRLRFLFSSFFSFSLSRAPNNKPIDMIDFSRTTRNDDDHDEDDYLTPCITRLLVLHLQPFHYTRVSRNGPPPSFTIDFRRQFSHNLLQGRTNLHPHVHNFPLLPFQRFLLPRSTRFVARARSSSIFKDSFIISEMTKSKSGTNRDRERMNGGYSFASSYLRIERVRSNVFKSGVRRSCALRLNLLVAITRVVTGFPTLFIALTRSVLFPFSLFFPKFHPVSIFHTSFFKVTISIGVPSFFHFIFYIYSLFKDIKQSKKYIYFFLLGNSPTFIHATRILT